jgi:hypothetical protein
MAMAIAAVGNPASVLLELETGVPAAVREVRHRAKLRDRWCLVIRHAGKGIGLLSKSVG